MNFNKYIKFLVIILLYLQNSLGTFILFVPFIKLLHHFRPIFTKPEINTYTEITPQQKYDLSWYVVSETEEIDKNPKKVTVWGKDYVIWKTNDNKYIALQDVCSHRGVELSRGCIINDEIQCPYHGYHFSKTGNLTKVPGMNFQPSEKYNVHRFSLVNKNGWLYLNTYPVPWNITDNQMDTLNSKIFIEPEANDPNMSVVLLNKEFNTYGRIVSENSLDIMHIGYVHTFGNKERPAPIYEDPPKMIENFHYKTSYLYHSGKESMVKKIFNIDKINVENEFVLPHSTIARVKFGDGFINTVITTACPINETSTRLFVKSYRNFLNGYFYNKIFKKLMEDTLQQDKSVIEGIKNENMDGKFNMKYDKLQNVYRTLYKKYIHHIE
jgi:phenylpropionate dioxygenase-like ring-hydroxylating dioxygenase large terminal subunit